MNGNHIANATILISAPTARVWDALTQPDLIRQYLFGTEVTTDWQVGSPIIYRGEWQGKPYEDKGKVLEVVPGRKITSTFWSSLSGDPDQPEYYKTVQYELDNQGSATRLTVIQNNNASAEEAQHAAQNWQTVLEGIKRLLEEQ